MMEKTCGNCANYDDDKKECVYTSFSTGEEIHEHHEPTDKACEDWMECADTLEQRYAQLEKVARNLFNKVLDHNRLGIYGGVDISDFRDQLEALGVLCDD